MAKTDKATHVKTYNEKYGLVLELAISRLTPAQRKLLQKRVGDAIYRLGQKLYHLSILNNVLNTKPLDQDILEFYREDFNE